MVLLAMQFDIGANLGFYSFALAKSGWNVTSFEPMPANLALLKANFCANPDVVERIDLHQHGLGVWVIPISIATWYRPTTTSAMVMSRVGMTRTLAFHLWVITILAEDLL